MHRTARLPVRRVSTPRKSNLVFLALFLFLGILAASAGAYLLMRPQPLATKEKAPCKRGYDSPPASTSNVSETAKPAFTTGPQPSQDVAAISTSSPPASKKPAREVSLQQYQSALNYMDLSRKSGYSWVQEFHAKECLDCIRKDDPAFFDADHPDFQPRTSLKREDTQDLRAAWMAAMLSTGPIPDYTPTRDDQEDLAERQRIQRIGKRNARLMVEPGTQPQSEPEPR